MKLTITLGLLAAFGLALPTSAFGAKPTTHGTTGKGNTQVRVELNLVPSNALQTDLATATGNVTYRTKNGKSHFKGSLNFAFPAPSLGVVDAATAQAALFFLEFSHEGAVYGTCQLNGNVDPVTPVGSYRVNAQKASKKKGAHFAQGVCTSGLPAVQSGDKAIGYTYVAGVRVDFLTN